MLKRLMYTAAGLSAPGLALTFASERLIRPHLFYRGDWHSEPPEAVNFPHEEAAIFTADGYYSVSIYRAERVKFSSGDKLKGTPEEYKDASLSMSDHFGRYSVDPGNGTITFHIDRSSFPNLDDTTPVRRYELNGDELSWRVAARPDGSIPVTTLRRVR